MLCFLQSQIAQAGAVRGVVWWVKLPWEDIKVLLVAWTKRCSWRDQIKNHPEFMQWICWPQGVPSRGEYEVNSGEISEFGATGTARGDCREVLRATCSLLHTHACHSSVVCSHLWASYWMAPAQMFAWLLSESEQGTSTAEKKTPLSNCCLGCSHSSGQSWTATPSQAFYWHM